MFGREELEDKGSLQDQILAVERQLAQDKMIAGHSLRVFGRRTRRRITRPTTLVFAGSIGFVTAELLRARKIRKRARKQMRRQLRRHGRQQDQQPGSGRGGSSLLKPALQAAIAVAGSFLSGRNTNLPVEDPSHLSMNT